MIMDRPIATEEAKAAAAFAALEDWEAAGHPGAVSHEEFMAEILSTDKCPATTEDGDPSTPNTFA
ncbi:hypothetical protein ACFOY4_04475 [Actinomadura syzygii]|uniref:Uncharacterized protein n=1 Tax=Actinomadura syzygii TaxID=1427538 RepID=A0A5D0TX88_9ACTN|nr:hypothetical protein [Actinomadura syzygii]TYC09955.1 hypothetical protein FXF65_33150 [Actinomadura syzygii]